MSYFNNFFIPNLYFSNEVNLLLTSIYRIEKIGYNDRFKINIMLVKRVLLYKYLIITSILLLTVILITIYGLNMSKSEYKKKSNTKSEKLSSKIAEINSGMLPVDPKEDKEYNLMNCNSENEKNVEIESQSQKKDVSADLQLSTLKKDQKIIKIIKGDRFYSRLSFLDGDKVFQIRKLLRESGTDKITFFYKYNKTFLKMKASIPVKNYLEENGIPYLYYKNFNNVTFVKKYQIGHISTGWNLNSNHEFKLLKDKQISYYEFQNINAVKYKEKTKDDTRNEIKEENLIIEPKKVFENIICDSKNGNRGYSHSGNVSPEGNVSFNQIPEEITQTKNDCIRNVQDKAAPSLNNRIINLNTTESAKSKEIKESIKIIINSINLAKSLKNDINSSLMKNSNSYSDDLNVKKLKNNNIKDDNNSIEKSTKSWLSYLTLPSLNIINENDKRKTKRSIIIKPRYFERIIRSFYGKYI